jgi:dihydrofolate synthase/folylpolyglutamate synthase
MSAAMTPAECVEYLLSLQASGVKLGLDTMKALCQRLGHPERAVPAVHIAGTNGKGSTAALVEAALRAAGYRTALYTSPHLVRFAERIRVAGREIPDSALAARVTALRPVLEKLARTGHHATFFEATTALAFEHFRAERAAIAVVETGLGGRLDSTNVLSPAATAITSIGLDHMEFLGPTLESIAAEKAGILKRGVPAVLGPLPPAARAVIEARALEIGAPLAETAPAESPAWDPVRRLTTFRWRGTPFAVALPGLHQAANAALALDLLRVLSTHGWDLPGAAVRRAFETVRWPARFEILAHDPPLVLDGGHNPEGIARALETWLTCFGAPPGRIVFGCMKDKDAAAMLAPLAATGAELLLVPVQSHRTAAPESLIAHAGPRATASTLAQAFAQARSAPHPAGTLVLGSVYLAGEWSALHAGSPHQLALN